MRKKKLKRRLKRIRENNRKTVGLGWNTQKTVRRGTEKKEVVKLSLWEKIMNILKGNKNAS
ncbi:unnamed protein product [marine sediment metagenome]|uniref:Uncharacterized protein n=1 Tax=marine sediment metagenome TaxID=412755 RepID=X1G4U8_9ZZZZ